MKIVIAFDGSEESRKALHTAFNLADALQRDTELHAVSVVDYITSPTLLAEGPAGAPDLLATDAETELNVAQEIAKAEGRTIRIAVLRGHVADAILKYAHDIGASFIVAGTHGRKGMERAILGSTCEALVRRSDIPVLTVRKSSILAAISSQP